MQQAAERQNLAMIAAAAVAVMGLLAAVVLIASLVLDGPAISAAGGLRAGNIVPPTVTPTPFDPSVGAPLPTDRIVTFYGISGGSEVNGPASSLPINTPNGVSLDQLGREYTAADPSHPVQLGLDVVVNVFEDCYHDPVDFPTCTSTAAASVINNYIAYCQAHHLLLFLDVQLGTMTVKDMVTALLPYLENPIVELELDTEFHFPPSMTPKQIFYYDKGCGCWTYIRGSMDASEINWAIDALGQLVLQYHIPRKVLVFNQFDYGIITNIPKIKASPYVSVVQQMDGFGAPNLKVGNYGLFVTDQLVQYGGFKLFFTYQNSTCCIDTPLMTPQQVVAQLNPAPLFISYQ